jgi:predicted HicB family RNase H-like nuclease
MNKNELLAYKGYLGLVRLDPRDMTLRGRIINIDDLVTFQGQTTDEVAREFRNSIDDYLEQCEELGETPEKPFSGRLSLRMKPRTHRILRAYAQVKGNSLNGQISKVLDRFADNIAARNKSLDLTPEESANNRAAVASAKPKHKQSSKKSKIG